MKVKLIEESVLFISLLKWVALAAGIGVAAGSATALFLHLLAGAAAQAQGISFHLFFLPLGLFVSAVIVRYVARDAMGYGTEKVIEAVHKSDGRIRFQVIPAKLLATIVTIASGGSAGQVGPCAQIGGGLASAFARILNMDGNDWKKLVICGIGAGFAAVLGAPVAGAVFGVEVLFVGAILYEVLLPSFIAGIVSYHTASLLGVRYFHYQAHHLPPFSEVFFLEIVVSGIFFGICAILAIEAMTWSRRLFDRIPVWSPFRGLIGGGILICLAFLVSPRYLGLGSDLIADALQGGPLAWHAFLSKTLFTALTFASGGSGGIIAPLLVIGATAGSTFGDWSGLGGTTFAAIGLVSVLAGAANAPIAMSVLAIELFGRELGAYAAIACVVSFLITGHRSIFPTQIMAMKKSSSVEVDMGKELGHVEPRFQPRDKSLIGIGRRVSEKIAKRRRPDDPA